MKLDNRLTVTLVDESDLVWSGLRSISAARPEIRLVAPEWLARAPSFVDLTLVDPFPAGTFDPARLDALLRNPRLGRLAAFTWRADPVAVGQLMRRGLHSVISKGLPADQLPDALLRAGTVPHGSSVAPVPARAEHDHEHPEPVERLSPREAEMLSLVATGVTNQEIAAQMYLSINSVKTYIRSAYRKIGVERRSQAIVWVHAQHAGQATVDAEPVAAAGAA